MDCFNILAINPGSTSTKIAVYANDKNIFLKNIKHSAEDLKAFDKITDQFEFRKGVILQELSTAGIELSSIKAIVGRGGLLKPIESGVYQVNEAMKSDLRKGLMGEHASNLGGLIADDIAKVLGAKAYIADPVVVDELLPVARFAGHSLFSRLSIFHALNQKAIARMYASSVGKKYEDLNLVIAHLGGGISVGAHSNGRVIDVNNALDGEGPFSPERSGTLPAGQLAKLCFSGQYTYDEVKKIINGKGGLVGYTGSNDAYELEMKAIAGDQEAKLLQDAMSYGIGKWIGTMVAVLKGKVDAIILTGGIANNPFVVDYVKDMVSYAAPVIVYPGEDEMAALAMNGLLVMKGEITTKEYK
jgi:butyrate kinase